MADLFQTSKQNVAKLLKSIFAEAELGAACWRPRTWCRSRQ
jgi:hypothetical protein